MTQYALEITWPLHVQRSRNIQRGGEQDENVEPFLGKNVKSVKSIPLDCVLIRNVMCRVEKHGPRPIAVASTRMCTPRSPQHIFCCPVMAVYMGHGANGPEADTPPSIKRVDLGRKCNTLFRRCSLNAVLNLTYNMCRPERRSCMRLQSRALRPSARTISLSRR